MGREDQGITNNLHRWQVIPRVLCFITHQNSVLLLRGAPTKRIWPNKLNGVGGHVEANEDVQTAVLREINEETGLTVHDLQLCGITQINSGASVGILMFIWRATSDTRAVVNSHEGTLEWHPIQQLPNVDLVEDLNIILPRVLAMPPNAAPFFAQYHYNTDNQLQIQFSTLD